MCVNFRFRLCAYCKPTAVPSEINFIYNSMLNLIPVSFCTFVTFRVRVRVKVKVRFRVRVRFGFGIGNLNHI